MFVIKLLGFWQNNGDKEFLFYRVGIKKINEVELHGRRGNGCAEEAGGGRRRPGTQLELASAVECWAVMDMSYEGIPPCF